MWSGTIFFIRSDLSDKSLTVTADIGDAQAALPDFLICYGSDKKLDFPTNCSILTTDPLWCRVRLNPEGSALRASTLISTIFFWLNICISSQELLTYCCFSAVKQQVQFQPFSIPSFCFFCFSTQFCYKLSKNRFLAQTGILWTQWTKWTKWTQKSKVFHVVHLVHSKLFLGIPQKVPVQSFFNYVFLNFVFTCLFLS